MISPENYSELLSYRAGPVEFEGDYPERTLMLLDLKYIEAYDPKPVEHKGVVISFRPTKLRITALGEDALAEFEQSAKKKAEDKSQQRFQNKISVALVLVPLITFILGLLVEHFAGIIGLFFGLIG